VAADLRRVLRWFLTVPAGSLDLLAVSSCRRHLRSCATYERTSQCYCIKKGRETCQTHCWMRALVSGYTQKSSAWPRDLRHSMKRIHDWSHDLYVILVVSLASSQYLLQARSILRGRQQVTSEYRS
jgi:hypothetical protein